VISFSSDGRQLASGDLEGTVRLFEPATGLLLRSWRATPSGAITAISFSPNGSSVATASINNVRTWDSETGQLRFEFNVSTPVWGVVFHPTEPRLYSFGNGVIKEFDLDRREIINGATRRIRSVAVSPDGRYLAAGANDGFVRVYDAASGRLVRALTGPVGSVNAVVFSSDSVLLVAAGQDKQLDCGMWRMGAWQAR
jgi:WD40 repeat protein